MIKIPRKKRWKVPVNCNFIRKTTTLLPDSLTIVLLTLEIIIHGIQNCLLCSMKYHYSNKLNLCIETFSNIYNLKKANTEKECFNVLNEYY